MEIQVILENGCYGLYKVVVVYYIFKRVSLSTPFFIIFSKQTSKVEILNTSRFWTHHTFLKGFLAMFLMALMFLLPLTSNAQNPEPVYRRYTVDEGLPSSVVYHAFQDSKGYIWFATANGVSRFDGYKFENFDLQSGLVDNDVFEIYEDYRHRIWFLPMSGKLCFYENGRIEPYRYNHLIKRHFPNSRGPIKGSFYVDSVENIYLSLRQFNRFVISPEGVYSEFKNDPNNNVDVLELKKNKVLISTPYLPSARKVRFKGLDAEFEMLIKDLIGVPYAVHHHIFLLPMQDSSSILSINGNLLRIKNSAILGRKCYGEEIIWTSLDKNGNLWVSPLSGGIDCFKSNFSGEQPFRRFFDDFKVTSVLYDNEGAYWFTTLNDGVFYCPDINVLNYNDNSWLSDSRVNAVSASNQGVYIGYEFAFVDLLHKGTVKHYLSPNPSLTKNSVRSFFVDSEKNRVWACSIVNLNWIEKDVVKSYGLSSSQNVIFPKKIIKSKGGGYWVATTKGLVKIEDDEVIYESYVNSEFKGLIYDLAEDFNGVVWFCTINGIWTYDKGRYTYLGEKDTRMAFTCYSIIINPLDSTLWIGTNGAGIVIKKGDEISQITKNEGLVSNSINQMYFSDGNVWVATRNGLSRIIINGDKFEIKNFTKASGLPTNEVTSVCEFRDSVFVGTTKGLSVFNKNRVGECLTPPRIVISKLTVNDKDIDLTIPNLFLTYDQNSLSFDFLGFVYRNNGKINYRYRMLGIDSLWVYTQTPNCQYNGLADGEYKFEVEAQSYNGIWSKEPASFSFTIHSPFWKKIWFLMLLSLSISGLFFLIYRIRVNAIHRRNELLQNINLYKQQSLRQQMNPHFIFNTLNSIQLYILEKDSISSHKYLTKFARLMRLTLDNSLYSSIPLKDELEALRIYLDLERLRLEGKFEYVIEYGTDESILSYAIPTLIIQPFVENAIWHGISLRKDQMGWVKISLAESGNTITCVVEDNGVGRAVADRIRQSRKKEHKSHGSQITQQRIDLLGQMYREKFNIIYEDLFDGMGEPLGTRVTIVIPKDVKVNVNN